MKKEISAGIILYNNELDEKEFLLLKYPGGHWDFVKGKMEHSEQPMQTAIRETKEETGITDLEFIDKFKEEISYTFFINGEEIDKKVIFYLAKTNSVKIKISHEHLDFVWLNFENAIEKITYQNAKIILTKANSLLQNGI
jgi:8-oxo-dGTP pyrophosphatase MutT (NUDIX family)|tara:strand:- start:97 stop:516 length:420 start_codon:yes stop_codon:yes gene_type:complete